MRLRCLPLLGSLGLVSAVCAPQGKGIGHTSTPDTPKGFQNDPYYNQVANNASAVPGYQTVFTAFNGSYNAKGYLRYASLPTYDPTACSAKCNATANCGFFNIYFERDPSVAPDAPSCANPPSIVNIKCALWTSAILSDPNGSVNSGQYRGKFHVLMSGSNGYLADSLASSGGGGGSGGGGSTVPPENVNTTASTVIGTKNWSALLSDGSAVLNHMAPASDPTYDFSANDFFPYRNGTGNYHTGDITISWRQGTSGAWNLFDTSALRPANPVNSVTNGSLMHSDFSQVSPEAVGQMKVTRDWIADPSGDLILSVTVENPSSTDSLQLGSFGFPIEFNNIFNNRTADEVTARCNLVDPYLGLQAGYAQVTRLTGTGPNMVITPANVDTKFEAWRWLPEYNGPPYYYQTTGFEGLYSWEVLTEAWAENEWSAAEPWNPPTSVTLQPGKSVTYALRFTASQQVYDIEATVASVNKPVAVGLPGYVVPKDLTAQLYLNYSSPVSSIDVEPADALTFTKFSAKNNNWAAYNVQAADSAFGRVRVTVTYGDGTVQAIHYAVSASTIDTGSNLSEFFFKNSYFTQQDDPFGRNNTIIAYDYSVKAQITQEPRAWIAGIADEAGSIHEALDAKTARHPVASEVAQLELMVNDTIWGGLQDIGGYTPYGVKRSLFFYEPSEVPGYEYSPDIQWGGTWNKNNSWSVWRAYDYVHCSAIYYSLYRAERVSPGILQMKPASWYLTQAYNTVMASQALYPNGVPVTAYADTGLMGETMWRELLIDLQAENMTTEYDTMRAKMLSRTNAWAQESSPFGSEMVWDCTGQEPIYAWARYFNNTALQNKVLNSIRGYMPTVAHWTWNGNARRYWDFVYGGKLQRIERMGHHYGSGMNSIPLLDAYKYNTDPSSIAALYDLRVGYGGNTGPLTNINEEGFSSTAFHTWPDTLAWDAYSGDYGPNYLGTTLGSCSFLVEHPDFGWIAMGGNLAQSNGVLTVQPRDAVRREIYIAALGLHVSFDSGVISSFTFNPTTKEVSIQLNPENSGNGAETVMFWQSTLGQALSLTSQTSGAKFNGEVVAMPSTISFQG